MTLNLKNMRNFYSTNTFGAIRSRWSNNWSEAFFKLLFPQACKSCGVIIESGDKGEICPSCLAQITFLGTPCCPVCGLMFLKSGGDSHPCGTCKSTPPFFSQARSLVRYSGDVGTLIHSFKFRGDLSSLVTFGRWAENSVFSSLTPPDYIIPVPLHAKRIQERGFNQAALLAQVFFPQQKNKIKHFLYRRKNTTSQTQLGGVERRRNLKKCFALYPDVDVRNKIIYVVDDVYTTGTTVNECAKVLMKAGARCVEVATLAMVVRENE
jgi:ComF family protein